MKHPKAETGTTLLAVMLGYDGHRMHIEDAYRVALAQSDAPEGLDINQAAAVEAYAAGRQLLDSAIDRARKDIKAGGFNIPPTHLVKTGPGVPFATVEWLIPEGQTESIRQIIPGPAAKRMPMTEWEFLIARGLIDTAVATLTQDVPQQSQVPVHDEQMEGVQVPTDESVQGFPAGEGVATPQVTHER